MYLLLRLHIFLKTENWIPLLTEILLRIQRQSTGGKEMIDILHHFHSEFNKS